MRGASRSNGHCSSRHPGTSPTSHAISGAPERSRQRATALTRANADPNTRLTLAFVELAEGNANEARRLALAEMPHPNASMLLGVLDTEPESSMPAAVRAGLSLVAIP